MVGNWRFPQKSNVEFLGRLQILLLFYFWYFIKCSSSQEIALPILSSVNKKINKWRKKKGKKKWTHFMMQSNYGENWFWFVVISLVKPRFIRPKLLPPPNNVNVLSVKSAERWRLCLSTYLTSCKDLVYKISGYPVALKLSLKFMYI